MPAAELKSWLRWHLPPILRVLPHKQIKRLYLFLSPLHFTPMTLHLHLSFVSLSPATPLPWQPAGCHLYANTWEGKKKKNLRKEEKEMLSYWQNKHSLTILQASLFSIWLDMAFRETEACCLQSWVEGWQGQWAHSGGWWEKRTRLTLCGWTLAAKQIREEVQHKINPNCTNTHKWSPCWWRENAACFISLDLIKTFNWINCKAVVHSFRLIMINSLLFII